MLKMVARNTSVKFFMNNGIAREKAGVSISSLSMFSPIRLLVQHLPVVLWMMERAENQSIGFC